MLPREAINQETLVPAHKSKTPTETPTRDVYYLVAHRGQGVGIDKDQPKSSAKLVVTTVVRAGILILCLCRALRVCHLLPLHFFCFRFQGAYSLNGFHGLHQLKDNTFTK